MSLQDLSLNSETNNREELVVMPNNKEFTEELSEHKKYKLEKDGTLILKNKLVMKEGEHNGVFYSWNQLKEKYMTGEGAGLFFDHDDSVKNYTGLVNNLRLDESSKSIFGDIHITNKQSALDISLGAKWGVSPTIDAEKVLRDGKQYAMDPDFLSYSLVLRPAVRETMLNSDDSAKRRSIKVENNREINELAERDNRIQKLEDELSGLKDKSDEQEKELEESKKKIEESEKKEVEKESEELCELECSIGFTSDAEKNSRIEELKNLSSESRSNLKSAHEKYAKTLKLGEVKDDNGELAAEELKESFLEFRNRYLKENPNATSEMIRSAFAKLSADTELGNDSPTINENLKEESAQKRMKSELASESFKESKVNSNILAYMKEQEGK